MLQKKREKIIALILISFLCSSSFAEQRGEKKIQRLTLKESIQIALKHNFDILIRGEELKEARGGIKDAYSEVWPQLSANASHYHYEDHPYITNYYDDNYETSVSIDQLLFSSGRVSNTIKRSRLNLRASEERTRKTRQEISYKVEEAFNSCLLAEEFVRIYEETLSLAEEHLRIARERYEAGKVSHSDVLRAEVEVAEIKPKLIEAQNQLDIAKNLFKFLLKLDLTSEVELQGELVYDPLEMDPFEAANKALTNRPELKELKAQEGMRETEITIAKSGNKPSISLNFTDYINKEASFAPTRDEWDDYWIASVKVSLPFFDGFDAKGKAEQARARLVKTKLMKEKIGEQIKLEVGNAYLNLKAAQEVVASQTKNVERAKECYEVMETRYSMGKRSQTDLLDTRVALSTAQVNYAQSIYNYTIAKARLKLVIGLE